MRLGRRFPARIGLGMRPSISPRYVPSTGPQPLTDAGELDALAVFTADESITDATTVSALAIFSAAESFTDAGTVSAAASNTASDAISDVGTSSSAASHTGSDAIADTGTSSAASSHGISLNASDTFTRTVTGSWGTIEQGGSGWTNASGVASDASVDGAEALISWSTGHTAHHQLAGIIPRADIDQKVKLRSSALMNTGSLQLALIARVNGADFCRGVLIVDNSGAVSGEIRKVVGGSSSIITNGSGSFAALSSYTANTWLWLRFRVIGSTWSLKCWIDGNSEPAGFDIVGTEGVDVQAVGDAGVRAITLTGTTLPVFQFDGYTASPIGAASTLDSISDSGTSSAAASMPAVDLTDSGSNSALAIHSAAEALADTGTNTASATAAAKSVSDDANRADQGPPPSTNWDTDPEGIGAGGFTVTGNQFVPTNAVRNEMSWIGDAFGPNVDTAVDVPTLPASGSDLDLEIFTSSSWAGGLFDGYLAHYHQGGGLSLYRYSAGSPTLLISTSEVLTAGDTFRLRVGSATVEVWRKSGGAWQQIISVADTTHRNARNRIAIYTTGNAVRLDNFVASSPLYAEAIADSGTSTAAASQSGAQGDSGTNTGSGAASASEAIADSTTSAASASQTGTQALADQSTVSGAASQTGAEAIADAGTVAAVASVSGAQGDSGTSTGTGAFTGTEALADTGASRAFAVEGTRSVTDNANRADQGPPPSANWQTDPEGYGALGFTVTNNRFAPASSTDSEMAWIADTFGPEIDMAFDLPVVPPVGQQVDLEILTNWNLAAQAGYDFQYRGDGLITLYRADAGTYNSLATATQVLANGDAIRLRVTSRVVECWVRLAGEWVREIQVVDSTYRQSGVKVGVYTSGSTMRLDNFVASSPLYGEALADTGTSTASASNSGVQGDTGTSSSSAVLTAAEAITDQGEVDALALQFATGAEAGTNTGTGVFTASESLADQSTSTVAATASGADAIADSGTNTAAAAPSTGATADTGTSSSTATQAVTGESISDTGTLTALASTPNPVEQDTDQGTNTSTASQTASESLTDAGTVSGTVSPTAAAQGAVDSGTSTGQLIATGQDAIADSGTNAAQATTPVDQFDSGQNSGQAVHTASEAIADQGTVSASASMPLAPLADSGTVSAVASNPGLTPRITDTFDRTTSADLGSTTPDSHPWTRQSGSSTHMIVSGGALQGQPSSVNTEIYTLDDDSTDVEINFDLVYTQFPVGTNFTIAPVVRYDPFNGGQYIRGTLSLTSGGGHIAIQLTKVIGGNGTSLTSASTVITTPLLNTVYRVKLRVLGFRVAMKVWDASGAEPDWQLVGFLVPSDGVNDGASGLRLQTLAGTTTFPIFTIDNYTVTPVVPLEQIADSGASTHSGTQTVTGEAIGDAGTNVAFGFAPGITITDEGEVDALASQAASFGAVYEIGTCAALSSHTGLSYTSDSGTNLCAASATGAESISDSGTNTALAISFSPPIADTGEVDAHAVHSGADAVADSGTSAAAASFGQSTGAAGENQVSVAAAAVSGVESLTDAAVNNAVADFGQSQAAFQSSGESDSVASVTGSAALSDIGTSVSIATIPVGDAAADSGTTVVLGRTTGSDALAENQVTTSHATQQVLAESITDVGTEAALVSTPVPVQQDVDEGTNTSHATATGTEAKVDQGTGSAQAVITGSGVVVALFDSGTNTATAIVTGQSQVGTDAGTSTAHATSTGSEQLSDRGTSTAAASMPPVSPTFTEAGTNTAHAIPGFVAAITDSSTSTATVIGTGGVGWSDSGVAVVDAIPTGRDALVDSTIGASHTTFTGQESYTDRGAITAIGLPTGAASFAQSGTVAAASIVSGRDSLSESTIAAALAVVTGFGAAAEVQFVVAHAVSTGQDAKQDQGTVSGRSIFVYTTALADSGSIAAAASFSGTFFYSDRGFSVATAQATGLEKFIDTGRNTAIVTASAIETISAAGTVVAIGLPTGSQVFTQAGTLVAHAIASGSDALRDSGATAAIVVLTHDEALREVGRVVADAIVSGDQVLADAGFLVARAIHTGQFTWPDAGTNTATAIITGAFDFNLIIKGEVFLRDWAVAAVFLLDQLSTLAGVGDSAPVAVHSDAPAADVSTADSEAYTVSVGDS